MNELYDELKEKNFTAQSARKRTGGKRKYMFQSDRMSPSELKKMNGEIVVYTMKEPISWTRFKSYPKEHQKEYIQWFVDEFGVNKSAMCELFGVTPTPLYKYFKAQGYIDMLGRIMSKEGNERFHNWLKQFRPRAEEQPVVEEPKKEKVKIVENPVFFNTIASCEMNMEGKASEIAQTLFALFKDQKIAVNIVYGGVTEEQKNA